MKNIVAQLVKSIGKEQVFTDDLSLIAIAADAGCYRKIPKIVLKPRNENEVIESLRVLPMRSISINDRKRLFNTSFAAISLPTKTNR